MRADEQRGITSNYRATTSINISDLAEDETIGRQPLSLSNTVPNLNIFQPSEITGRSTLCPTQSVEDILAGSFSEDVREMGAALGELKIRASCGGESLPKTADISMSSAGRSSFTSMGDWECKGGFSQFYLDENIAAESENESFKSASKVYEF